MAQDSRCRAQGLSDRLMADSHLLCTPGPLPLSSASCWPPEDSELELGFCGGAAGSETLCSPGQRDSRIAAPRVFAMAKHVAAGAEGLPGQRPAPGDPRPRELLTPDLSSPAWSSPILLPGGPSPGMGDTCGTERPGV